MPKTIRTVDILFDLKVGASHLFKVEDKRKRASIRSCASKLGVDLERKYVCRSIPGGFQVWREA